MQLCDAVRFFREFTSFFEEKRRTDEDSIKERFSKNLEWTQFMLHGEDAFLKELMNRLVKLDSRESHRFQYSTEFYTVDAMYLSGDNLFRKKREDLIYPSEVHVLIEHENGPDTEEEMWKLLHWRCPLKVLISYDYSDEEKSKHKSKGEWCKEKIETLREMCARVHAFWPESQLSEYLIIIGNWGRSERIQWKASLIRVDKDTVTASPIRG